MRKIAAIFLMLVFLFNLLGYQCLIYFLQHKADQKLESLIDNNQYDESSLLEIRVNLNMPYQQRFTEFERHYGEITVDGKEYTYVKRKIEGDVLILKCVPNQSKQQLKETAGNITKSNSGQDQDNNSNKNNSAVKLFGADFDSRSLVCDYSAKDATGITFYTRYSSTLSDELIQTPHQPPQYI